MKSKNLLDIGTQIDNEINYISKNNETVISIEMNENTKKYLEKYNIYGFKNHVINIPIIINNNLMNNELKINREKNTDATPYCPYKMIGDLVQDGAPTPDSPIDIKQNIKVAYKNGKVEQKEIILSPLKQGDKIQKINGNWYLKLWR